MSDLISLAASGAAFRQGMNLSGHNGKAPTLFAGANRILDGQSYVTADVAEHLWGLLTGDDPAKRPHELLSAHELRVMTLIASGKSIFEIAELMHLSPKTVSGYRASAMAEGGWANNTEMTKYCLHHGLAESG